MKTLITLIAIAGLMSPLAYAEQKAKGSNPKGHCSQASSMDRFAASTPKAAKKKTKTVRTKSGASVK